MEGKEGRERKEERREINYLKQRLGEIEKRESEQLLREREGKTGAKCEGEDNAKEENHERAKVLIMH